MHPLRKIHVTWMAWVWGAEHQGRPPSKPAVVPVSGRQMLRCAACLRDVRCAAGVQCVLLRMQIVSYLLDRS